jgi:cytochrome c biogenesis protein CcmG/thiol:disulfide interchange protein DsbE
LFPALRFIIFALSVVLLYVFWQKFGAEAIVTSVHAPVSVSAELVGKPAPEMRVPRDRVFSKQDFLLAQLKGYPVVVHFWATWCAPCVQELPELAKKAQELRKQGYSVVAVAVDENWGKLDDFFVRYPNLSSIKDSTILVLDPRGEIAEKFGSSRFPESFLINDQLVIDNKLVGAQPWNDPQIDPYIRRLRTRP